jgi:hypothetical protein
VLAASPVATTSVRYLEIPEEPEALSTVPSESLGCRLVPIVIMSDTESESDGKGPAIWPVDAESAVLTLSVIVLVRFCTGDAESESDRLSDSKAVSDT